MMTLSEFICNLYEACNKTNLKLVMVRNYEGLPSQKIGNDIDLIVKERSVNKWLQVLVELCDKYDLQLIISKQYSYCTKTIIKGIKGEHNGLEIDLNNSFCWRGVDFYSIEQYIEKSNLANEYINSCGIVVNYYITFCHGFLYGGTVSRKYVQSYKDILEKDTSKQYMCKLMNIILSENDAELIVSLLSSGKAGEIEQLSRKLRIKILLKSFLKRPIYTAYNLIRSYFFDLSK